VGCAGRHGGVLDAARIRVEIVADPAAITAAFSGQAQIYVR
jgi:hypothetical protein